MRKVVLVLCVLLALTVAVATGHYVGTVQGNFLARAPVAENYPALYPHSDL